MTATIEREWVALASPTATVAGHGSHPCQGLYHRPTGRRPTVAFLATHYNVDFSEHYLAPLMAERGFGFLGWNTRFRGNEVSFDLGHALVDIGVGVKWLREVAGVDTVILLGNSGGGSLMAAYQSQAVAPHLVESFGRPVPDAAHDLGPADYYVSLNAHPGRPQVLTAWLDPSVTDETDPASTDPALDMFNRDHGPVYDEAFIARYRAAQVARNERITDWAIAELARLEATGTWDRTFDVHRTWADLRFDDLTIDPSTRRLGCYGGRASFVNRGPFGLGRTNTLRSWLMMWSLRTSPCVGDVHLGRITVSSLVIQSTGDRGVYPSDARAIAGALGAADVTLELVPGEHYFEDVDRGPVADLMADWVAGLAR